jgi:hypothetical protein
MQQAQALLVAYMPMKAHVHHLSTDLAQSGLRGYRSHSFPVNFWKCVSASTCSADRERRRLNGTTTTDVGRWHQRVPSRRFTA